MEHRKPDWDPRAPHVLKNQLAAYDEMRRTCPVAYSESLQWCLFRHDDIMRVLLDHETFSNAASRFVSVPNTLDPPRHGGYRAIIDPYFSDEAMAAFEPRCRQEARSLVNQLARNQSVDFISDFAMKYALAVQCAFLGWPLELQEPLRQWVHKNHAATLSQNRQSTAAVAEEFAGFIHKMLDDRRAAGSDAPDDVISSLMRCTVNDRPLTEEEIVSILRNWTGGEVGTMSSAVGIIVHYLADNPELQAELRNNPEKLPYAIDEILRIHGPLISNRRVATRPVEIRGRQIDAGERLTIFWVSANRDEEVFEDPSEFKWDRDQSKNLLYGAGIHWCPGQPLARLELRVVLEELLAQTMNLALLPDRPAPHAVYPASGYAEAHVAVS